MGLIVTMRTNGRTVADNPGVISQTGKELADAEVEQFFARMKELGYSRDKALELAYAKANGGESDE
jgi:DNA-binding transcriptional regulator YhcF (GntR family)